mmetsp:Transcript_51677/g.137645  ORF Transcript_51677/g.137645 Transcript_51677/m.137645 type:complete len:238 (-) Transcript_51677:1022-1735(-)
MLLHSMDQLFVASDCLSSSSATSSLFSPGGGALCHSISVPGVHRHHDALHLRVVLERVLALLAAPAAGLEAAERGRHVEVVVAVDPDGPSLQAPRCRKCRANVAGADPRAEAVVRVVRPLDCLVQSFEFHELHHWPEDLLLGDLHVVLDVGEDRGLHVVSLRAQAAPAERHIGSLGLASLDVAENLVELKFVHLRAQVADGYVGLRCHVALRAQALGHRHDLGDELIVDVLVNEDPA